MPDDKDRLGDKLKDVERGREDHYFAERDRELLKKLKSEKSEEQEAVAARNHCPKCGTLLTQSVLQEVTVDECPGCGGIWLDKGEFEELAKREKEGWLGWFLRARKSHAD